MPRTRTLWIGLALAVCTSGPIRADDDPPKQEKKQSADERYQAILKEYNDAYAAWVKAYEDAKTLEEREKSSDKAPIRAEFADRLMKFVEDEPKSNAAFDALIWIGTKPMGPQSQPTLKALDILERDYLSKEEIADVAAAMRHHTTARGERFLRAVLEKSPSHKAKGVACLTLARHFGGCAKIADRLNDPKTPQTNLKFLKLNIGEDYVAALAARGGNALKRESDALYLRAREEFADVPTLQNSTVGVEADRDLFEQNHLTIGKPAPEILGEDIDGKPLKLSDFKGKVVVLDFFGDW